MADTETPTRLRLATGNWLIGEVAGLEVQALMFDEPSDYGMLRDGRISRLWIAGSAGTVYYDFDRGDILVDRIDADSMQTVLAALDAYKAP